MQYATQTPQSAFYNTNYVIFPLLKLTNWIAEISGATLNWGVLIAWADLFPADQMYRVLPLYMSTVLYTVIYDTIYSHQVLTWPF